MYKACVIVISDKEYTGEIEDQLGKGIVEYLKSKKLNVAVYRIIPEVKDIIKDLFIKCCDEYGVELLFVCGAGDMTKEIMKEVSDSNELNVQDDMCYSRRNETILSLIKNQINNDDIDLEKINNTIELLGH